ncbi:MAG: DUF4062 domain-containing protein [bacterium]
MPKAIKVMISSRCNDEIELEGKPATYSDVRLRLKDEIESMTLTDAPLFEVWINEDSPPKDAADDLWEHCLAQVEECDILITLYNGDAGWAQQKGDVGICHAELQRALSTAPAKVRLINMNLEQTEDEKSEAIHQNFQKYVKAQLLFDKEITSADELPQVVRETLNETVIEMVQLGKREAKKGKYHLGEALDWSRLDFVSRKTQIEGVLRDNILKRDGSENTASTDAILFEINRQKVLALTHAVPASMSVAAARELVGRPFLKDHTHAELLAEDIAGPVHFIGCQKNVTETQAVNLLGQPDIVVINAPFGIYAIDIVYFIQVVFLSDCRDPSSTRHACQRFFDWLFQSREAPKMIDRAHRRKRIVQAIAEQVEK